MAAEWVLSVGQLNEYVRRQLAADPMLRSVRIRGEISNFKRHYSGHWYFALKDDQARVACVMFRQSNLGVNFEPKDGMRVVITGNVSLYVRDGAYQVYCDAMRQDGVGELYLRFEELKQKLSGEGLFDPAIKKPLPLLPRRIGVVTSKSGAVLRDIVRVARRRYPLADILLCPAAVQGEGAAQEIARAIELLNRHGGVDVILCGRGGGSMEDLWAFNEEVVARAIHKSKIPVVSCVGHETDFTIADFVADVRAPTPSAAAELAVPVYEDLKREIGQMRSRLTRAQEGYLSALRKELKLLLSAPSLTRPEKMLIESRKNELERWQKALSAAMEKVLADGRTRLNLKMQALSGLNPNAVLERGYALVSRRGEWIGSASELNREDELTLHMRGGQADVKVLSLRQKEERQDGSQEKGRN